MEYCFPSVRRLHKVPNPCATSGVANSDQWLDPLTTVFRALADLLEPQLRSAFERGAQRRVDARAVIPVRRERPEVGLVEAALGDETPEPP